MSDTATRKELDLLFSIIKDDQAQLWKEIYRLREALNQAKKGEVKDER